MFFVLVNLAHHHKKKMPAIFEISFFSFIATISEIDNSLVMNDSYFGQKIKLNKICIIKMISADISYKSSGQSLEGVKLFQFFSDSHKCKPKKVCSVPLGCINAFRGLKITACCPYCIFICAFSQECITG